LAKKIPTKKRLSRLEKALGQIQSDVGALGAGTDRLRSRVKKARRRYAALERDHAAMRQAYEQLRAYPGEFTQALRRAEAAIGALRDEMGSVSALTKQLAERDQHTSRLNALEDGLEQLSVQLKDIARRFPEKVVDQEGLYERLEQIQQSAEADGRLLASMEHRMQGIQALRSEVSQLSERVSTTDARVSAMAGFQDDAGKGLAQLSAEQSGLAKKFDGVREQTLAAAETSAACLRGSEAARREVKKLGQELGGLREALAASDDGRKEQEADISRIREQQETLGARAGEVEAELQRTQAGLVRDHVDNRRLKQLLAAVFMIFIIAIGLGYWHTWTRVEYQRASLERSRDAIGERLTVLETAIPQFAASAVKTDSGQRKESSSGHDAGSNERALENHAQRLKAGEAALEEIGARLEQVESYQLDLSRDLKMLSEARRKALVESPLQVAEPPSLPNSNGMLGLHGPPWLRDRDAAHYTVQLIGLRRKAALDQVAKRYSLPKPVAWHRRQHQGGDWFVLLYGDYPSRREAQRALDDLPPQLKTNGPWVVSFRQIHEELDRYGESPQ
jgi:chromosome segregation ATPase